MLLTYKIRHTAFTTSMCIFPQQQCCQPQYAGPSLKPASILSTLHFKLPQKNIND
jgi:hypothetical protein